MHYFDYAATTPLHPDAAYVYGKLSQDCYGNTSSLHEVGAEAQNMLALCRKELADNARCACQPESIFHCQAAPKAIYFPSFRWQRRIAIKETILLRQ